MAKMRHDDARSNKSRVLLYYKSKSTLSFYARINQMRDLKLKARGFFGWPKWRHAAIFKVSQIEIKRVEAEGVLAVM